MKNLLVFLLNTGSANEITDKECYKFISLFLSDKNVIDMNPLLSLFLLKFILKKKAPAMRERYELYCKDGINPYHVYYESLNTKLNNKALNQDFKDYKEIKFIHLNAYSKPYINDLTKDLLLSQFTNKDLVQDYIVLPLYPQFCNNTVMASFALLQNKMQEMGITLDKDTLITSYFKKDSYIDKIKESVESYIKDGYHLVISYHSMLMSYIEKGDIYEKECILNTELLINKLKLTKDQYTHCYQSPYGPYRWLKPFLYPSLKKLKKDGIKKVVVIAPSFSIDCSETLYEIDIKGREIFTENNKDSDFVYIKSLNDDDFAVDFIFNEIMEKIK